jgi:transcriptional regulator with XRE-family HTH domain
MAALKQARLDAGLTQTELADRLERPQSFVAKYENGERRVEVVEFVQIVRAIGCDGNAILRGIVLAEGETD